MGKIQRLRGNGFGMDVEMGFCEGSSGEPRINTRIETGHVIGLRQEQQDAGKKEEEEEAQNHQNHPLPSASPDSTDSLRDLARLAGRLFSKLQTLASVPLAEFLAVCNNPQRQPRSSIVTVPNCDEPDEAFTAAQTACYYFLSPAVTRNSRNFSHKFKKILDS
jgi:hypothetical protein